MFEIHFKFMTQMILLLLHRREETHLRAFHEGVFIYTWNRKIAHLFTHWLVL